MGLLDDAIREHLELKRKHGADPSEVARQEREALGAGRMPPPPAAPAETAGAPDAVPAGDVGDPRADAPLPDGLSTPSREPADVAEPIEVPEPPEPVEPLDAPPPERGGAVSMSRAAQDEPDVEWSDPVPLDDPEASTAEPPEEDVLEETPEFLQETPEHDRLWFEQRPPKDFDF